MSRDHIVLIVVLCALVAGGLAGVVIWSEEAETSIDTDFDEQRLETPASVRRANRRGEAESAAEPEASEPAEVVEAENPGPEGAPPLRPEDAALWGRVRDREGRAVPRAVVSLARDASPRAGRPRPGPDLALVETDDQGRYRLDALAPGDWLSLRVRHEGFAAKAIGGVTLVPGLSKHLDVTLLRGDRLHGRVVDERGDPLKDVLVRAAPQEAFMLLPGTAEEGRARTDENGLFAIEHLGQGYKRVWTEAPGIATGVKVQVLVRKGEGAGPIEFSLGAAASIRGIVLDGDGRPVKGAVVSARAKQDARSVASGPKGGYPGVETDIEGRFALEGLPEGAYTVSARHPAFSARGAFRNARTSTREVEIRMQRNPLLRGRVVDAETGEPIRRFRLLASATPDLSIEAPQLEQHFDDEAGAFAYSLSRRSGQIWLIAKARGYAGGRVGPIAIGAQGPEQVIEMMRGVTVSGRVTDAQGQGVSGVRVQVEAARSEVEGRMAEAVYAGLKSLRYHARTDAAGHWKVSGVMPGLYRLRAEARGHAAARTERAVRIPKGESYSFDELVLRRPARVRGVVREQGAGTRARSVVLRELEGGRVRFRGSIAPDGNYVIEDIAPGSYLIEVHRLLRRANGSGDDSREITLGAGEELVLDF